MMENIIAPIDKHLLNEDIKNCTFVRNTNKGNNKVYIFDYKMAPNLLNELGRLREITFREAGGGTNKKMDIDQYDIGEYPYQQLIVWDEEESEIVGGYRFKNLGDYPKEIHRELPLATKGMFNFSDQFYKDYFPYTIELGRSFVQPKYQPKKDSRKGLFSLDNLWDGLGALAINYDSKYFFGKITMYPSFNRYGRDLILHFFDRYFPDSNNLVVAKSPIQIAAPTEEMHEILSHGSYELCYKALSRKLKNLGTNIPPLVNAYMNLSSSMKVFKTAINHNFGNVEETGILITIADVYPGKSRRHFESYTKQ